MALLCRILLVKLFKAAKNERALNSASKKSLEPQIGREHLEGAFSDPSMGTQGMDRIQLARSPKDIEKGALREPKRKSRKGSTAGGDHFEKLSLVEGVSLASETKRDVWSELDPFCFRTARVGRCVRDFRSFGTTRPDTRQVIAR